MMVYVYDFTPSSSHTHTHTPVAHRINPTHALLPTHTHTQSNRYRECPGPGCGRMLKGCPCCPTMTCPDCRARFCFFHSNAHPNKRWGVGAVLRTGVACFFLCVCVSLSTLSSTSPPHQPKADNHPHPAERVVALFLPPSPPFPFHPHPHPSQQLLAVRPPTLSLSLTPLPLSLSLPNASPPLPLALSLSCWQYALRLRKDSQQSRRTVLAIARPCPRCSAPTGACTTPRHTRRCLSCLCGFVHGRAHGGSGRFGFGWVGCVCVPFD